MTRQLGALIGAVALSLVVPAQHATAKMPALTVDIRPEQPVAGEVATFDLRTWARTAEDEPLRPSDQWGPRLWLPIWAHRDGMWPRGGGRLEHATRLRFERVGPARYEARTSLGYAGRWIVALRFEGSPDRELLEFSVDERTQVRVASSSSVLGQPRAVTFFAHLAAFAALGVLALWTRKQRSIRRVDRAGVRHHGHYRGPLP